VEKEDFHSYIFDYVQLEKFDIDDSELPEGSEIINIPNSFYSEYKIVFWSFVLVVMVLLALVAGLSINSVNRIKTESALKASTEQVNSLSRQLQQYSLAVADMIIEEKPEKIFTRISRTIAEYSDYRRVMISYFIDEFPYREIIEFAGVDEETVKGLRKIEMPLEHYMVIKRGIPVGKLSYYVPHTMKEILNRDGTIFGSGPIPEEDNSWHPEDNLFVWMKDKEGNIIGVISVDESKSGKRPTPETVRPLEIFSRVISQIIILNKAEEEKQALEEQLFHAQKMESVGRLAGGIAHDFNNLLVGIIGYAELLKMHHSSTETLEGQAADVIIKGAERAANLTKQLLGFARGGKYNTVPLNINNAVLETLKVSEKIFEKNIDVIKKFDKNIYNIEADRYQIDQVLTNIFINAKDAMPNGGRITINTDNVYINPDESRKIHGLKSGMYIRISIGDNGIGMPKEVLDNIFEPFFSTKGKGKGTGLGLATVYGIVENHNGHINVSSESGSGSTFTLYFPASEKQVAKPGENVVLFKGSGTILVVDDETNVRSLTRNMLEQLGYNPMTAGSGKDAIRVMNRKKEAVDLVLLDMIMPEMAGKETFIAMRKIIPDVKILLMSGYSQNGKAEELMESGALGFIQKPFKMQDLSKKLNEIFN